MGRARVGARGASRGTTQRQNRGRREGAATAAFGLVAFVIGLLPVLFTPPAVAQPAVAPAAAPCLRPNAPPQTVRAVAPVIPDAARKAGVSGDVAVLIEIDDHGHVVNASVLKSPSTLLDAAALDSARNSQFNPEIRDCVPRGGKYTFVVSFQCEVPPLTPIDFDISPTSLAAFRGSNDGSTIGVLRATFRANGTASVELPLPRGVDPALGRELTNAVARLRFNVKSECGPPPSTGYLSFDLAKGTIPR